MKFKRLLAMLLAAVCLLTVLPVCAVAETGDYDKDTVLAYVVSKVKLFETSIDISQFKIDYSHFRELLYDITDVDELFMLTQAISCSYVQPGNYITTLKVSYIPEADTAAERDALNKGYKDVAATLVKGVADNTRLSEAQKALVLHDRLALYVNYNYDGFNSRNVPDIDHTGQGALVNRRAVCDGYAKAYRYLLSLVGIESRVISSETLGHAWNVVKIDGNEYYVDVTWDDCYEDKQMFVSHAHFLKSYNAFVEHNASDYPAINDSTAYDSYFWDKNGLLSPFILVGNDIYYFDLYYLKKYGSDTKLATTNNNQQYILTDGTDVFYTKSGKLYRYKVGTGVSTELWTFGLTGTEVGLEYNDGVFTHTVMDGKTKKTEDIDYRSVLVKYTADGDYIYLSTLDVISGDLATALGKKIYGKDGKELDANTILYTGCKTEDNKYVVIKGDTDGDGKLTDKDANAIKRHIQGFAKLSGAYAAAASLGGDGGINIVDYVVLRRHLSGKAKLY